jgi:hypothetical protein
MVNYSYKNAVIEGENQEYRYSLKRTWDESKKEILFVLTNPSKADALEDDKTVEQCFKLADYNGYGGFEIVNLFAFRATNPKCLIGHEKDELVGDEGDKYIFEALKGKSKVVLGWGNAVKELKDVKNFKRDKEVAELLQNNVNGLYCAELTIKGCPKHPLYISGKTDFFEIEWDGKKFIK